MSSYRLVAFRSNAEPVADRTDLQYQLASSGSHMCYLAVFVVFVFITLYKVSCHERSGTWLWWLPLL